MSDAEIAELERLHMEWFAHGAEPCNTCEIVEGEQEACDAGLALKQRFFAAAWIHTPALIALIRSERALADELAAALAQSHIGGGVHPRCASCAALTKHAAARGAK